MEFKQLRTLVEVIHTGSFTEAAKNLFLSQPTVSQHIMQLEEELGCRLVMRTTRRIEITAAGHSAATYAEDILALRDRMITNCSRHGNSILSISASTIPSAYILPSVLRRFGKEHPGVYFSIHQNDSAGAEAGVLEGLYDIGITGRRPEHKELEAEHLCSDNMVMITPVTPYFLELKEKNASAAQLLDQPIILREEGSGSLKAADKYLKAHGIDENSLHVIARVNDQEAIKNMVSGGLGVSFISSRAAAEFVEAKRVLCFSLPEGEAVRHFYVIRRRGSIETGIGREFVRFLHANCS